MAEKADPARGQRPGPLESSSNADNHQIAQNRTGPQAAFAINFRVYKKNTLLGFFDLELLSGMILAGCGLHEKNGKRWVGLPAKPYQAADGKQTWAKVVDFKDRRTAARFQEIATAAAVAAFERVRGVA